MSVPPPKDDGKSKEKDGRESIDKTCSTSGGESVARGYEDGGGQSENNSILRDDVANPIPFRIGEVEGLAPDDEDVTRGSRSDVDGAGLGENISCNDSREGDRDENGTESFEGRGRSHIGANTVYLSRRLQKHSWQSSLLDRGKGKAVTTVSRSSARSTTPPLCQQTKWVFSGDNTGMNFAGFSSICALRQIKSPAGHGSYVTVNGLISKAADTNATGGAQHQGEESQVVPMRDMIQRETDKSESDSPPAEIGKGVDATPKPFNGASYKKAVGGGDIVGSLRSKLASKEGVAIQQALDRMIAQPHAVSADFQRISDSILRRFILKETLGETSLVAMDAVQFITNHSNTESWNKMAENCHAETQAIISSYIKFLNNLMQQWQR
ncbi:hypothetical protein F5141DRAFT_1062073 [Pisolithus sp. B1]|nr:hypothetical protein F5141DRAFT_1062073 [Pisolithus sp. B1]